MSGERKDQIPEKNGSDKVSDEPIPLTCDLCETRESIFTAPAYNPNGILEEWVCSGLIQKPTDENDIHDTINTVRLCLENKGGITAREFTTWEGSVVATALNMAVTVDLEHNQPTLGRVEELIKLGYTDQNDQKKGDT